MYVPGLGYFSIQSIKATQKSDQGQGCVCVCRKLNEQQIQRH